MIRTAFVLFVALFVSASAEAQGTSSSKGMYLMRLGESCRTQDECSEHLVCKTGVCVKTDSLNRGEVGEPCSGPAAGVRECISGRCGADFTCAPSLKSAAPNFSACVIPTECRSRVCEQGICQPSPKSRALPGQACTVPGACLSNVCIDAGSGRRVCAYDRQRAASCAPIGTRVGIPLECCSGVIDGNGTCAATPDPDCTNSGNCKASVDRICGDIGTRVMSSAQCCSGKAAMGRCVINTQNRFQPCRLDRACRSGLCDPYTGLCQNPQEFLGRKHNRGTAPSSHTGDQ